MNGTTIQTHGDNWEKEHEGQYMEWHTSLKEDWKGHRVATETRQRGSCAVTSDKIYQVKPFEEQKMALNHESREVFVTSITDCIPLLLNIYIHLFICIDIKIFFFFNV